METRDDSHRKLASELVPVWGLLIAAAVLLSVAAVLRYMTTTPSGIVGGGLSLLVPWLLLGVAALLIALRTGPLQLALIAASGSLALVFAAPLVIDQLPGLGLRNAFWVDPTAFSPVVPDVANGETTLLRISEWVNALGSLLLLAFAVIAVMSLRSLLLGPAVRSAFGIDMTVLLTVFAVVAIFVGLSGSSDFGVSSLADRAFIGPIYELNMRTYAWVVPLVVWVALMVRQGGALAIGATSGMVVAFLVVPTAMNFLGGVIGNAVPRYSTFDDDITPYAVFDWTGQKPVLGLIAVVMLGVALWWALGVQGSGRSFTVATAASPTNTLSVVAFAFSWLPITAIPGIILGHMAYDQIVDSREQQRGIGLARWSIILGYVSILGAAFLIYINVFGG